MADRLAQRLTLDPSERAERLRNFPVRVRRRKRLDTDAYSPDPEVLKLTSDQFHAVAEWTHFAILSLIKLPGFQEDPEWIAGRLGIVAKRSPKELRARLSPELASTFFRSPSSDR